MEIATELLLQGHQYKKLYEKYILQVREKYDLKKIDVDVIYYLHHAHGHNLSKDIISENLFNKGQISQSVYHLQEKGFITAVTDGNDRRCVHLSVSRAGQNVVSEIYEARQRLYSAIFNGITDDEKEALKTVAVKIRDNIEKLL